MRKRILVSISISIFFIVVSVFKVFSQVATVTIYYSGAQSWGCCNVCGTDYMCIGSSGCGCCQVAQQTKTFIDPVPAGNFVTGVTITYYAADCSATNVPTSLNGVFVCTAVNSGAHSCLCGSCNAATCTSSYPCGLPGYVYGGVNTLYANPAPNGTEICTQRVVIKLNYAPGLPGAPAMPGVISGPTSVCPGQTCTYTITAVAGATSYNWTVPAGATINSGQGTTTITVTFGASGGNICVTASNSCGTSAARCLAVTLNPIPTVTINASINPICAGQSSTLTAGGAATYTWSNGLGTGNPVVVNPVTTTTYYVTGSNGGCTNTASITLTVNPTPTVTLTSSPNPLCTGQSTTLTAGGASTYSWNNGLGTGNPKVVAPAITTTYIVTGTNGSGCTNTASVTVTVNPVPSLIVSGSPNPICAGQPTTLTASGASTYSWSNGLGTGNPVVTNPASTTTYIVTGTNGTGCTNTASVTIIVNANPTLSASASPNTICLGASTTLFVSGATSYAWSNGLGTNNSVTVTPTITTTYTVTGTSSGCTNTATVTVTVNPGVSATISASQNPICLGFPSTLTAGGGSTYSWSNGLGTGNPVVVSPSTTTTYSVTVTNLPGCSGLAAITITVNASPSVTVTASLSPICQGNSSTLTAGGASTYSWNNGLGSGNPQIVSPAVTTTYTVTGTTGAGCSGSASVTIVVNPVTANAGPDGNRGTCSSSVYLLNGSGTGTPPLTYSWSPTNGLSNSNIANPIATPGSTTNYTLTVTNGIGCTATDAVTVTVTPLTVNAGPDVNQGACSSSTNTLNGSATGAGPFTFLWTPATGLSNPNIANPVADPLTTTLYTLTVTDMYGCTATDALIVNVSPLVVNAGPDVSQGACSTSTNTLNGSGSGANPLTFLWTPAAGLSNPNITNPVADPATTTTYTLMVTDMYGCTATDDVTVTVAPIVTANAGPDASIGACAGALNANLNGSGTGSGPLTYSWTPVTGLSNPNIANPVANPSTTTTYTLTVADIYGCTASDNVIVNVAPMPTSNAGPDGNIGACGATSYVLNGSGTGAGPLVYSWTPVTGLSNPGIPNPTATPSGTTNYTLTVTDIYGCTATDVVTVTVNPGPSADAGPDGNIGSCSTSNYTLSGSGTGSPPLTYSWLPATGLSNPGIPNPVAHPGSTITYTLTVTDSYGCSASDAVLVNVFPLPTSNAGSDGSIGSCAQSTYTLNGSGTGSVPLIFSWTPTTGLNNPNIANPVAQPTVTTIYTFTVTDAFGCTATDAATVTVDPMPTANAGVDASVGSCVTSTIMLNGSGSGTAPLIYTWSPSTGLTNPSIPNPVCHPSSTTTYTLTVTDMYGCTATDAVIISVDPAPVSNAGPDATIGSCVSSTITLNGSGTGIAPITYSWNPPAGLNNPNISNPLASPAVTTVYTLTVTDGYGCTASDAAIITVYPMPTANAGADANIGTCATSTTTLNGSGSGALPLTYSWMPSTGLSNPNISNPVAKPVSTTIYTLIVIDNYGCSASDAVVITVDPLPTANAGTDVNIGACTGSSTTLNGTGTGTAPLTYLWSPATGLNNPGIHNPVASPATTTTYTLTINDTYGCTATDQVMVIVDPIPTANAGPDVNIGACSSSSTTLNGSGTGTAPITFSWTPTTNLSNPSIFNPVAHPLSTTNYTLTITDMYGCTASDFVTISVNPLPSANAGPDVTIGACATSTASLNGSVTGTGTSFIWTPSSGLNDPTILNPVAKPAVNTTYTLFVTDSYGCTASDAVVVTIDALPTCNAGNDGFIGNCISSTYTLNGSVTGTGTTFLWSPPAGLSNPGILTPVAKPTATTTYTLTVTDLYGCTATDAVLVTVNPLPVVNAGPDAGIGSCPSSIAYLNGTVSGSSPLTYSWSPATGLNNPNIANPQAHPSSTTTYTLTGTDTFGCTASDALVITVSPLPTADAGNNVTIGSCPASTTTLNGTVTGIGVTSQWTPSNGLSNPNILNPVANPASTTTYVLVATDIFGCSVIDNVIVTVAPLPVVLVTPSAPAICAGNNINLTASGAVTYTWTPTTGLSSPTGASVNAFPNTTTTYTVTGSDIYSCTNTASVTITVYQIPTIVIVPASSTICIGNSVNLTASGASTYTWSPPGGLNGTNTASVTANPAATIIYTVSGETNGCIGSNTVMVTVNPLPNIVFTSMPDICSNAAPINLTYATPAGGTYSGTGVNGNLFDPGLTGPGSHVITYIYTDANNCTNSVLQSITEIAAPNVTIAPVNPSICLGTSVTLNASGAANYTWDPTTGLSSASGSSVTANPTITTSYIVTGQANGCSNTATVTVNIYTGIAVQIIPGDTSICPGKSMILTAMGGLTYVWDPPAGLSSTTAAIVLATPAVTTTYSVTGTDAGGCVGSATATVSLYPVNQTGFFTIPKIGCAPLTVNLMFAPAPSIQDSSWHWHFDDPSSGCANTSCEVNPSHTFVNPNSYIITLNCNTTDGCAVTAHDTVSVLPVPVADFFANPMITSIEDPLIKFTNQSTGSNYWHWNFDDPVSGDQDSSILQHPNHYFTNIGYYEVTLVAGNNSGCLDTTFKYITIQEALTFFVPNAFTPNGDGKNDIFLPKGIGIESFEMWVYDRWGENIYYTNDMDKGWNGKNIRTGKTQPEGLYTYVIILQDNTNLFHKFTGAITLLK